MNYAWYWVQNITAIITIYVLGLILLLWNWDLSYEYLERDRRYSKTFLVSTLSSLALGLSLTLVMNEANSIGDWRARYYSILIGVVAFLAVLLKILIEYYRRFSLCSIPRYVSSASIIAMLSAFIIPYMVSFRGISLKSIHGFVVFLCVISLVFALGATLVLLVAAFRGGKHLIRSLLVLIFLLYTFSFLFVLLLIKYENVIVNNRLGQLSLVYIGIYILSVATDLVILEEITRQRRIDCGSETSLT